VQTKYGLLPFALEGHRLAWLLHGQPDGPGVGGIAFVADVEGFDKPYRHQPDLVAHLGELPRPMVRAAAGLHANQAWAAVDEERQELDALDLPVDDLACGLIDVVHLKDVLGDVDSNGRKLDGVFLAVCQ
jgi:hypothetical protein